MPRASSRPLIVGNWKMYKTISETRDYIRALLPLIDAHSARTWLAVPFTAINAAAEQAKGSPLLIGAQNVSAADEGAFTGEVSCSMLKEAGAVFAIVGHSERRHIFGETNAVVNQKVQKLLKNGLTPIMCIGETAEQHQSSHVKDVLSVQLFESLMEIDVQDFSRLKIAYEPVWAIGTNLTATPEHAQEMHHFCRQLIKSQWGTEAAQAVEILYGGSVKPENAASMLAQQDINGLLAGGSSLNVESFSQIINGQYINAS